MSAHATRCATQHQGESWKVKGWLLLELPRFGAAWIGSAFWRGHFFRGSCRQGSVCSSCSRGDEDNFMNTIGQAASTLCWLVFLLVSRTSIRWSSSASRSSAPPSGTAPSANCLSSRYTCTQQSCSGGTDASLFASIQWGHTKDAPYPIYGLICGICVTLIFFTSLNVVRRRFEVFYFPHQATRGGCHYTDPAPW